ncbi:DNA replication/repair protein RecF [Gayadomonas joobiniege]|uniref:DNA replication/repair protein RecF n=1 Tax=Gayadomonas joobiniege TaxID=1234606 RepID=UPI00037B2717|nr:DNA replication and repair protein RecF [Gayadomonas joobiniege]
MYISRLVIQNVRNVSHLDISLNDKFNVIVGENGSGKTSFLESIHLLGFGRSFRKSKNSELINFSETQLTVHAAARFKKSDTVKQSFGISKFKNGDNQIRVKGQKVARLSELSSYFPIISFTNDSLDLIEGSPSFRRRLIDWLVFHVEQSTNCSAVYRDYARVLEQRNSALRHHKIELVKSFDQQLIKLNANIHSYRQQMVAQLNDEFNQQFKSLDDKFLNSDVKLIYKAGWNTSQSYSDIIADTLAQDLKRKTTSYGVHRDDVLFLIDDRNIKHLLSRGESKRFVLALLLAAERLIFKMTDKNCIWLFDDICAELDFDSIKKTFELVADLDNQMFFSCIEKDLDLIKQVVTRNNFYSVFHVKHGQLLE